MVIVGMPAESHESLKRAQQRTRTGALGKVDRGGRVPSKTEAEEQQAAKQGALVSVQKVVAGLGEESCGAEVRSPWVLRK